MIERYETSLQNCLDQGVMIDGSMRQRMLIGHPAERYKFLKQNYLLSTVSSYKIVSKDSLQRLFCTSLERAELTVLVYDI